MNRIRFNKIISMLVVLFIVSFTSAAVSQESQETLTIKGTIVSISADTGKVVVKDESDKMEALTTTSAEDVKDFSQGDLVVIEYGSDGVIKSIKKQKQQG